MLGVAAFAARGASQAALVATAALILSLLLPPLMWVSGAAIALIALRKGPRHGIIAVAIALLAALAFGTLAEGRPVATLLLAAAVWLPVLCAGIVLRITVRLDLGLMVAGVVGLAVVIGFYLVSQDPAAFWYDLLTGALPVERVQAELDLNAVEFNAADWEQLVADVSRLMTGSIGAMLALNTSLSLVLARWWQAALFNPGGFGEEFRALRYGQAPAIVALTIAAAALVLRWELLVNLAMVVVTLYLFPGLAIAHAVVKGRKANRGWLIGMYALMVLALPQMALLIAGLGVVDTWLDLRRRLVRTADRE